METIRSFAIGVITEGDTEPVLNGLRFPTREAAEVFGRDLWARWTAVKSWAVVERPEEPNA